MTTMVMAFIWLCAALIVGKAARMTAPALRRYFIPTSVIAGLLLLLLGPELGGRIWPTGPAGPLGVEVYELWRSLPGFLINIVFAALFLGKALPGWREIWRRAGPQIAFGQSLAWGQYVVGIGVTMLLLTPIYGVPPMFGALIEIGFEGGHGTAAGLGPTFVEVGWAEGQDLALAVATVGVVMGVVLGMLLINWGIAAGHTQVVTSQGRATLLRTDLERESEGRGDRKYQGDGSPTLGFETIEALSFHLAYIGAAIGLGALMLQLLIGLEALTLTRWGLPPLLQHIPLFPLAMIGGIGVQALRDRFAPQVALDRQMIVRLQGAALDFLIVSALATLSLSVLADNWQPLAILILAGLTWNTMLFVFLARRMIPRYWFERGIGDFGQSIGMTATGLLLMRMVDPDNQTPALEAFGYKQLLFEPFVGGGLVTALSLPLIFNFGPGLFLLTATLMLIFFLLLGLCYFGRQLAAGSIKGER